MSPSDTTGRSTTSNGLRRFALILGTFEFLATPIWTVAGAGFYGSPLSGVKPEGLPMLGLLFVLAGPLGLLPAALVAKRWPRAAGRALVAGAVAAIALSLHPYGLGLAAWNLYVDVRFVLVAIAMVTLAIGAGFLTAGRSLRAWLEVPVISFVAVQLAGVLTMMIGMREDNRPWRVAHPVSFLAFAPDGNTVVAGGESFSVNASGASLSLIDAGSGRARTIAFGNSKYVLSSDRAWLASRDADRSMLVWDTTTWVAKNVATRSEKFDVAASGVAAVRTLDGTLLLLDSRSGERLASIVHPREAQWLALSPDASQVAIGGYPGSPPVALWDVRASTVRTLAIPSGQNVLDGRWSPDGKKLALSVDRDGDADGTLVIELLDPRGQREILVLGEGMPWQPPWFSPDATLRAARNEFPAPGQPPITVSTLWDRDGRELASFPSGGWTAWCPDGTLVVADTGGLRSTSDDDSSATITIRRRSGRDGSVLAELGELDFLPANLACSPDSSAVVASSGTEFVIDQEVTRLAILR